ncbi:MAG: multidrug effflux MFS transporter [Azoarcus sp.]|jgi:DHA1 family bicyclomycin/chloramphenicol resistance-like MFS transporter|nr:multidrug effflux MFS transporter [Azoarcus sp.]
MNKNNSQAGLALMLAALAAIGPFTIDAYLPAFPEIGAELGADKGAVQETLSLYLLTFGLMTLWHGAFSDSFGRKRVILAGLIVYALASLGCALATSIEMLWWMRIAQGLSAGAGMVVSRAMVRDIYAEGPGAQQLMSKIALMFAIAPAVAPIIGGWILRFFGWRAIFVFLALAAIGLCLICKWKLPESLPPEKRQPFAISALFHGYKNVFSNVRFLLLAFGLGAFFGGFFFYVLSAPVFIREHLGLDETQFHWLFVPSMVGTMVGAWISGRIAGRWDERRTLRLAFAMMGIGAFINLVASCFWPSSLPFAVLHFIPYTLGVAIAMPNVTLMMLDIFPKTRGMAASCQSCVQTTFNAFLASVLVPLLWHSRTGMAFGMAGLGMMGAIIVFGSLKARRQK